MPWESIGSVETGNIPDDEVWITFCLGLAKTYIRFVCGDPPEEGKLDIMWQDHDLGSYPSLGVWYEYEEPAEYISACENALETFDQAVSWERLKANAQSDERFEDPDGNDDEDF